MYTSIYGLMLHLGQCYACSNLLKLVPSVTLCSLVYSSYLCMYMALPFSWSIHVHAYMYFLPSFLSSFLSFLPSFLLWPSFLTHSSCILPLSSWHLIFPSLFLPFPLSSLSLSPYSPLPPLSLLLSPFSSSLPLPILLSLSYLFSSLPLLPLSLSPSSSPLPLLPSPSPLSPSPPQDAAWGESRGVGWGPREKHSVRLPCHHTQRHLTQQVTTHHIIIHTSSTHDMYMYISKSICDLYITTWLYKLVFLTSYSCRLH